MATVTYSAALMDAETGGNEQYLFEADPRLFDMPADSIVEQFIKHLESTGNHPHPLSYELNSAVKKKSDRFVLATGSLMLAKGEIPFLLMISSGTPDQTR